MHQRNFNTKSILRNNNKILSRFGQEYNNCLFVCYGFVLCVCVSRKKYLRHERVGKRQGWVSSLSPFVHDPGFMTWDTGGNCCMKHSTLDFSTPRGSRQRAAARCGHAWSALLALCCCGWNTNHALGWALKSQYLISLLFPKHKDRKSFLRGWGTGKNRLECPPGKWEPILSLPHLVCLDLGAMAQRGEEGAFLWFFGFFLLLRGRQIKCAYALWTKTRKEINLTLESVWTDLVIAIFGKTHEANGQSDSCPIASC